MPSGPETLWDRSGKVEGQQMGRDYELTDEDIVELNFANNGSAADYPGGSSLRGALGARWPSRRKAEPSACGLLSHDHDSHRQWHGFVNFDLATGGPLEVRVPVEQSLGGFHILRLQDRVSYDALVARRSSRLA